VVVRGGRAGGAALVAALLFSACTAGSGDPSSGPSATSPAPAPGASTTAPRESPSPGPSEAATGPATADPVIAEVPVEQWRRMVAAGMWREGCPVTRKDLRRLEVNHVDFQGGVRRGVLVVNADVADSLARIFTRLFEAGFPIRRMQPTEAYDGDSDASLRADNTSAYNCRRPDQINAPPLKSPHANGRAIDINPRENPWVDPRCGCWSPTGRFHERRPGKGVILRNGVVWRAFRDEGWIWQNIDVPDYMHFDTGYPSVPFRPRAAAPNG
jgi:hypothetical protein